MEFQIMSTVLTEVRVLNHPPLRGHLNLIQLFGYGWEFLDFGFLPFIVLEFADFGSLDQFLISRVDKLSVAAKLNICMDLLSGLDTLHFCDITHGDVKLENVLVAANDADPEGFIVKIADFSHCVVDSPRSKDNWILGTTMCAAPEVRTTIPPCFLLNDGSLAIFSHSDLPLGIA